MFAILSEILKKNHIDSFAPLPLRDCKVIKPYLLEREGIADGTVFIMAVPYYTHACDAPDRNLSAYAVSRDYHLFFQILYATVLSQLRTAFPNAKFVAFTDHSPIDEIHAAASAGLGVIGENGLILTPKYGSYVFLGEIVTDAIIPCEIGEIKTCEGCMACKRVCPANIVKSDCLSALTQKKGTLSLEEQEKILHLGSVWGCDLCQAACPHNKRALREGTIYSPIPFFTEQVLPHLTSEVLNAMTEAEFTARAYSWRGKQTIARNLNLMEKGEPTC